MSGLEERALVYSVLVVACAFVGAFAGLWTGFGSLVQLAAVVEALYWFGPPRPGVHRHRQNRILFN